MADVQKESVRHVEELLEADGVLAAPHLLDEKENGNIAKGVEWTYNKPVRIIFKNLEKSKSGGVLQKVEKPKANGSSELAEVEHLPNLVSQLTAGTGQKKVERRFTKDDLFIVPIVDKELKIIGSSVFAFLRKPWLKKD